MGWTKGLEFAKIARRDRQDFDCATRVAQSPRDAREQFKQEVGRS